MLVGIYKITNTINGKVYIGQSTNLSTRWAVHKSKAKNGHSNMYISNAINKYGPTLFTYEVIEECSKAELDEKEKYWISYYDSTNRDKGYNQLPGGHHTTISQDMTEEVLENITNDLKNTKFTMRQIGDKYGMCEDTISSINTGRRWFRDGIDYPIRKKRADSVVISREELINKMKEIGKIVGVAAYYECSVATIRARCREYNIPSDMKLFYKALDDGKLL